MQLPAVLLLFLPHKAQSVHETKRRLGRLKAEETEKGKAEEAADPRLFPKASGMFTVPRQRGGKGNGAKALC